MKKKLLFIAGVPALILLAVLGIGTYLNSSASSEDFVVSDGVLTKYTGNDQDITIPLTVTSIGSQAFSGNPLVTSVSIPEGVTSIGSDAFTNCTALVAVNIPDSVTDIGSSAFLGCSKLRNVSLGSGLRTLGDGAFADCDSLESMEIRNSSFMINDGALCSSNGQKLYQYLAGSPASVYNMSSLVKDISRYAFWGADNLEEINVSPSASKIPEYSLANCKNLKNVIINAPVNEIGLSAFLGDTSLKQVVMPESMTSIHTNAFDNCSSDIIFVCNAGTYPAKYAEEKGYLTSSESVVFVDKTSVLSNQSVSSKPESSTVSSGSVSSDSVSTGSASYNLVDEFFADESGSVSSSSSGENVEKDGGALTEPFKGYENLGTQGESRIVSDKVFVSIGDMPVVDGTEKHQSDITNDNQDYSYYKSDITEYHFEQSVTKIGKLMFARSALKSIDIPEGVTEIGYGAFYHCDNLEEVSIPVSVTFVGEHAFDFTPWYQRWLKNENTSDYLIVGDGVLIGYKGDASSADEADIPEEVKTISDGVF